MYYVDLPLEICTIPFICAIVVLQRSYWHSLGGEARLGVLCASLMTLVPVSGRLAGMIPRYNVAVQSMVISGCVVSILYRGTLRSRPTNALMVKFSEQGVHLDTVGCSINFVAPPVLRIL